MRAVDIAARHGVPITPRGGGTSQAGQSIGAGIVLDTSKHLNRILEINPDETLGPRRAGRGARRAERGAAPAQPALRPGRVVGQPRHRRRHDGQQLERRAIGALRQDHRSRARAARGVVRRRARAFSAARSRAGRRGDGRRQHRSARVSRRSRSSASVTPPRSSAAFRRCCAASAATTSMRSSIRHARRPDAHHGRLRRHARLHRRREDQAGAAAEAEVGADDRVRSSCSTRSAPRR